MIRAAILTISDKGSRGERVDESGSVIRAMISGPEVDVVAYDVVPDEKDVIAAKLVELSDTLGATLIITTGGTGVSPRDVTPEATMSVIGRALPGMAEAMRAESMKMTPNAMLSRAVCGIRGETLIVNLPGSPRAVRENLAVVLPAIRHAVEKICGSDSDCAR